MKTYQQLAGVALLASSALAFPANMPIDVRDIVLDKIEKRLNVPGFNAKEQYVSTSGVHRYIAPDFANGAQRGPCPGLNALANHGYLPRSGYGGIIEMAQGTFNGDCLLRRLPTQAHMFQAPVSAKISLCSSPPMALSRLVMACIGPSVDLHLAACYRRRSRASLASHWVSRFLTTSTRVMAQR